MLTKDVHYVYTWLFNIRYTVTRTTGSVSFKRRTCNMHMRQNKLDVGEGWLTKLNAARKKKLFYFTTSFA